jgi:hypothetical protein
MACHYITTKHAINYSYELGGAEICGLFGGFQHLDYIEYSGKIVERIWKEPVHDLILGIMTVLT